MAKKSTQKQEQKKKELTDKQKKFVIEYVDCYNATQAAIRAGYSEKTAKQQGSRLLTNVDVLARVREEQEEELKKRAISPARIIDSTWQVYERCMQLVPVMEYDRVSKQMVETGEFVFDSKGALRALEQIGKYIGMLSPDSDKDSDTPNNNLFEAIASSTNKDVNIDGIQELEQAAESDSDMVE